MRANATVIQIVAGFVWLSSFLFPSKSLLSQTTSGVDYIAGFGQRYVGNESGAPLPSGNEVRLGFFDEGFDFDSNANNFTALEDAWTQFDATTIREFAGQEGLFTGSVRTQEPTFDNLKLYCWIFHTTDNGPPTADYENVLAHGVFSSSDIKWRYPAHDAIPPNNIVLISSSEVDESPIGAHNDQSLVVAPIESGEGLSLVQWKTDFFGDPNSELAEKNTMRTPMTIDSPTSRNTCWERTR